MKYIIAVIQPDRWKKCWTASRKRNPPGNRDQCYRPGPTKSIAEVYRSQHCNRSRQSAQESEAGDRRQRELRPIGHRCNPGRRPDGKRGDGKIFVMI